jgi:hypothetical protein
LISKFEKAFEVIRINKRDYKETLRRYNFRKPRREAGPSEQVNLISIFNFEKEKHKDNLQQEEEVSLHLSQPHFGLSVRMKLALPKVGTWSPPGLPKTQSSS